MLNAGDWNGNNRIYGGGRFFFFRFSKELFCFCGRETVVKTTAIVKYPHFAIEMRRVPKAVHLMRTSAVTQQERKGNPGFQFLHAFLRK